MPSVEPPPGDEPAPGLASLRSSETSDTLRPSLVF